MTLQELLNTDVEDIGRLLKTAFAWWGRELGAMAPAGLRRAFGGRPALTAEPKPGGGYRFTRDGQLASAPALAGGRAAPVVLLLPRDQVLLREVPTPDLPERDIRRMLQLDVDRLTPFPADRIYADIAFVDRRGETAAGRRRAMVAAVQRATADAALADARAAGLEPRAVAVADAPPGEPAVDFAPAMRETGVLPPPSHDRAWTWGLVALLLVANLGVAVGRDMVATSRFRDAIEAQRPRAEAANRLRRQVQVEDERRRDLVRRQAVGEPLRVLDAASLALPSAAWVQRLVWDGRAVRMAGFRQDSVDVVEALRREPIFAEVRNSVADAPPRMAAGVPFDVTAQVRPPALAGPLPPLLSGARR